MCFDFFMRRHQILNSGKFQATINVEYPEGAVCTCSLGNKTYTAPNTNGTVVFVVNKPGTWTITSNEAGNILTGQITVTEEQNAIYNYVFPYVIFNFLCNRIGANCYIQLGNIRESGVSNAANTQILNTGEKRYAVGLRAYYVGTWTVHSDYAGQNLDTSFNVTSDTMNQYLYQKMGINAQFAANVSTTATAGVNYSTSITAIDWATFSSYAKIIAKNNNITSSTGTVYIEDGENNYKISTGTTRTITINGGSHTFAIVGFNTDKVVNSNTYGSTYAGITFAATNGNVASRPYGSTVKWSNSDLRNWLNNTCLNTIQSDLRNVIAKIYKYNNNGNDSSEDYLTCLSAYEYGDTIGGGGLIIGGFNGGLKDGTTYKYYADGNNVSIPSSGLWIRSYDSILYGYNSSGNDEVPVMTSYRGVAPSFCI